MCRWLAYSGSPVLLQQLLYEPQNSLVVQSLHSRLGAEETNGDGFGVGWYGIQETPAVFRSIDPAWNDRNLRELADHVTATVVFAHIRASTGSPVQQTNCHPFRHGRWLWMHNGLIREYQAVNAELFPEFEGTTDSETLFHLALTFGLEEDPPAAVERAIGLVELLGREHAVEYPFQGTIATTDGESIWAFRYSSEGKSRSLFFSTDVRTLRALYPDNELLRQFDDDSRLVVSEPLGDELPGAWNEVPEASWSVIKPGRDELHPFAPAADFAGASR
jgi:glutamine amidotransferase